MNKYTISLGEVIYIYINTLINIQFRYSKIYIYSDRIPILLFVCVYLTLYNLYMYINMRGVYTVYIDVSFIVFIIIRIKQQ